MEEPRPTFFAISRSNLSPITNLSTQPTHLSWSTPCILNGVRIVQDLSIEPDSEKLSEEQQGTQVITEVLDATPDSLFPLQGALGYEIYQTLFIGPNSLVVGRGVGPTVYIQTISALLEERGKVGLSTELDNYPVGGSDKVPTFVALIGAQEHLNVAVLIDFQKKDQQSVENLYKRELLNKRKVLTYADHTSKATKPISRICSAPTSI